MKLKKMIRAENVVSKIISKLQLTRKCGVRNWKCTIKLDFPPCTPSKNLMEIRNNE